MIDDAPSSVTLEGTGPQFSKWPAVDKPTPLGKGKFTLGFEEVGGEGIGTMRNQTATA